MKRQIALALLAIFAAIAGWSCDGDDDDEGDATATSPAATSTNTPASTATPLASGIVIDEPAADASVAVPITMSGEANVFEAALTIDALGNAAGAVLCTRHVQATSGTGTPGTWEGVLAFPPPADSVPITLRAYTFSAMDGSMQDVVERSVTLSSERPDIIITSPTCAQEVTGATLAVEGMAEVFEAALVVDIRDASGTTLLSQNVTAASGTEFSPWSATFDISGLTAAFYDVVAYSGSAQDGSIINVFPVQISVSP
jgi:hypothetical protein